MSGLSPTQRSKNNLTDRGYLVCNVEQWKRFPDKRARACPSCGSRKEVAIRSDLFGFADLLCLHPQTKEVLLVQVSTAAHHSDRKMKILASMEAKLCLLAGCKILVMSWYPPKSPAPYRQEYVTLHDFEQAFAYPNTVRELVEIKRRAKKSDLPPGSTLPLSEDLGKEAF